MAQQPIYHPYAGQAPQYAAAVELETMKTHPFPPPPSNASPDFSHHQPPQQHAYPQYGWSPTAVASTSQFSNEKNDGAQWPAPVRADDNNTTTQSQSQVFREDKGDLADEKYQALIKKAIDKELKPLVEEVEQFRAVSEKIKEGYTAKDIAGQYNGGSYLASNNDSGSLLVVKLGGHVPLIAKPGAMVAKSYGINLRGKLSFSWIKLLTRSGFAKSEYTGEGEVVLAPSCLGSISVIQVNTVNPASNDTPYTAEWKVGRDSFLAATHAVESDYQTQNLTQAMFSGEGLFVYVFRGWGPLFVQGLGAIVERKLEADETFTIDNGFLVAWNCKYVLERVASGGIISGVSSREGLACRFTGPGTVLYQTRKIEDVWAHLKKANR